MGKREREKWGGKRGGWLLGTGVAEEKRGWEGKQQTGGDRHRERERWEVGRNLFKRKQ